MLLYTLMPLDIVLDGADDDYELDEITIDNIKLLVEPIDLKHGKITRLISSNPQDYLNPKYSPGNIFNYRDNK